jgi:hypothetical protein
MDMPSWHVSGSYFEACNCDAICPCRRRGGVKIGTGCSYGVCDFALSWRVIIGHSGDVDLSGFSVVLAGSYRDDEPGKPWRVCLYVDEQGSIAQQSALTDIFLGRAGGTSFRNFASAIGEVYAIRPARIELDHAPRRWFMKAGEYVLVRATVPVSSDGTISCAIPGHDRPGEELQSEIMRVDDDRLRWEVTGRCGFSSTFDYRSDVA